MNLQLFSDYGIQSVGPKARELCRQYFSKANFSQLKIFDSSLICFIDMSVNIWKSLTQLDNFPNVQEWFRQLHGSSVAPDACWLYWRQGISLQPVLSVRESCRHTCCPQCERKQSGAVLSTWEGCGGNPPAKGSVLEAEAGCFLPRGALLLYLTERKLVLSPFLSVKTYALCIRPFACSLCLSISPTHGAFCWKADLEARSGCWGNRWLAVLSHFFSPSGRRWNVDQDWMHLAMMLFDY